MADEINDQTICPFCGLPVEPGQETAEVNGKTLHFNCYQEQRGADTLLL